MKAERWTCNSDAIYEYYLNCGYVPHEIGDGTVIWIKANEKH